MKIDISDKALRGLLASGEGRDRMHYDNKLRGFAVRVIVLTASCLLW